MNILIADDDASMRKILNAYFSKEGFTTFLAPDGQQALNLFYGNHIDLAILDWMMPGLDGVAACNEMKKRRAINVIMLTAKSENEDELFALHSGADDYVRKPFDPRILLLRAKKILGMEGVLHLDPFRIDLQCYKAWKNKLNLNLTKKEFELLKVFMQNNGRILSRQLLLDQVWGYDYFGDDRTVDTHIRRLREKIGEEYIITHRGMGYCFETNKS
ncbi:response regulator transcription factor [Bacillus sp. 1P06AnD]|uniref:response regulator transcription factor n=1 Tax=Bacillus sp. 1P06AnD TaxID=3132208 RepID=UPI00399F61E2